MNTQAGRKEYMDYEMTKIHFLSYMSPQSSHVGLTYRYPKVPMMCHGMTQLRVATFKRAAYQL